MMNRHGEETVDESYGGVFVYNRPEQVLEQYELEVKSVSKGRESYICDTNQGQKLLKEYRGSMERAEFLAGILEHLRQQGVLVETVTRTREGAPIAVAEDETKYIVSDAFMGAECDTKNRDDMVEAVKRLAELHKLAETYQGEIPEFVKSDPDALLLLYEKHNRELNKVKNYIRAKKKKNEFELLFSGQYAGYMEKADRVTARLREMEPEPELVGFCHGDYNQHNVIFARKEIAIVHFDGFSYQIQMSDLANFMRKMMEKNNWNIGLGMDFIRAYDRVRKLSEKELRYLYLYMAYPEKFWKIANHYYNAHKAWISGRNIEKLEKFISQEEAREQFLEMLFNFTSEKG